MIDLNREILRPELSGMRNKRFLQPLAIALVCLFFALLFFSTAIIHISRLEATLLDLLENKALIIIEEFERLSQEKFNHLTSKIDIIPEVTIDLTGLEEDFSVRESFAWNLINIAREIDLKEEGGLLSENGIRDLATSENINTIAIFDDNGRMTIQSGLIPEAVLPRVRLLLEGKGEISIDLFEGTVEQSSFGLVGLRRKIGKGTILLVLDRKGLRHWETRVAIQVAIEEESWEQDVLYLSVMDSADRILGSAGDYLRTEWEKETSRPSAENGAGSRWLKSGSLKVLEAYAPFKLNNRVVGTVSLGLDGKRVDDLIRKNRVQIFLSVGFMLIIGLVAVWFLYRNQNQHLARTQDMMERLHQAERLTSFGQLAAGVAHEIRNPLNAISMATQRIQREFGHSQMEKKSEFLQLTNVIRDEILRLNGIIEDFLSLSRSKFDLRSQPIVELLERIIHLVQEETASRNISIESRCGNSRPMVFMDADKMKQALLNLINNALESISGQGGITLSVDAKDEKHVSIKISDTGAGISPADITRIFDPHYTTKEMGLGLGLPIAYEIIRAHNGDLRVQSEIGKGTTFEVLLPNEKNGG
ncbi:PAS domain-containing sensor histidine kinase [Thermodesulfobacteriota bacterium]